MSFTREASIRRQQDALAQILRDPIEQIANYSVPLWMQHHNLENILLVNFSRIPYCAGLYALDNEGRQITNYVTRNGIVPGSSGRSHADKPYMNKLVPAWGFLLSDIYYSQHQNCPSLTALQVVRCDEAVRGYIGVDFDLRDLPFTSDWFPDSTKWVEFPTTRIAGDSGGHTPRKASHIDQNLNSVLDSLEELLTRRGIFHCHIHFASDQVTIWSGTDPFQYRILDLADLTTRETLAIYPRQDYPARATIPSNKIRLILSRLKALRSTSGMVYLRHASINIINGMINLGFTCDSSQYITYEKFIKKDIQKWLESVEKQELAKQV